MQNNIRVRFCRSGSGRSSRPAAGTAAIAAAGGRIFSGICILSICLFCPIVMVGCAGVRNTSIRGFRDFYHEMHESLPQASRVEVKETPLTVSVVGMPLREFVRYVAFHANVSVVCEKSLDNMPVTVEVSRQDAAKILNVVARRLGVQLTRSGHLYYLGSLRAEDRGVLVRRARRLQRDELDGAVKILLSEHGRSQAYADGLVVVGDKLEVLERIDELLDRIESAASASWVVQYYLIASRGHDLDAFGLESTPSMDIAVTFAESSKEGSSVVVNATGGLHELLKATRERGDVSLLSDPLFAIADGEEGQFRSGRRIPIPRKSVSDQGTVTTQGFDYVQTGLQVKCKIREVGVHSIRVVTEVSFSDVGQFVENVPITDERLYSGTSVCESGGVYLLGLLERSESEKGWGGGLGTVRTRRADSEVVQVWCRAYRIGSAAIGPEVPPVPESQPEGLVQQ